MKFLCVLCDRPMKLVELSPPDRGSLSIVYECPECAHRIAMLTNPLETQLVRSLGVEVGPGDAAKCPFSAMIGEPAGGGAAPGDIPWAADALARLERIPELVRPMARAGIERYARDQGATRIDAAVLERARGFFGM